MREEVILWEGEKGGSTLFEGSIAGSSRRKKGKLRVVEGRKGGKEGSEVVGVGRLEGKRVSNGEKRVSVRRFGDEDKYRRSRG